MANFKRVLVTGGAGFIGSNYVRLARTRHPEWEIVVLDKLAYAGNLENLAEVQDSITFVHGDIANPEDVSRAMEGVDAVVNFAAESHVDRSLMDSRPFIKTNVEGTLVLLEGARRFGVKRFLHVSTDEVYGDVFGTDRLSLENDRFAPRSPYAASKAAAEHLVSSYGISHGVDVVVTRGSNTYGPYQYPEKIIPLFITNIMEGKPLPVYGQGTAVRDYMHVDDHCGGIDTVLHHGKTGEAYNVGARMEVPGIEVAQRILKLMGRSDDMIHYVTDRPGHDYRYAVDPAKTEALGWQRVWNWEDGLAQTVRWYVEHEGWWRRVKEKRQFQDHEVTWYAKR